MTNQVVYIPFYSRYFSHSDLVDHCKVVEQIDNWISKSLLIPQRHQSKGTVMIIYFVSNQTSACQIFFPWPSIVDAIIWDLYFPVNKSAAFKKIEARSLNGIASHCGFAFIARLIASWIDFVGVLYQEHNAVLWSWGTFWVCSWDYFVTGDRILIQISEVRHQETLWLDWN